MKKICALTVIGMMSAFATSAQTALVKEAEKAFKSADSYEKYSKALQTITPAFTNPETEKDANTYWIPGKNGFRIYDDMFVKLQFGQSPKPDEVEMAEILLDAYNYGIKALAVDTVVDAKGKTKTKYSKDIVSTLVGRHNDMLNAGNSMLNGGKYAKAYEAYTNYVTMPFNPSFGKLAPKAPADTLIAEIDYYRALAAWQAEQLPQAAEAFDEMMKIGYKDQQAYDYAFSVAYQMKDEDRKLAYSKAAAEKFGAENPIFLQRVINSYIDGGKFDEAKQMIDQALQNDPYNGAYYLALGVLYDSQKNQDGAADAFKKGVELAPENAFCNLYYGRSLLQKYDKLDNEAGNMSQAEYNKYAYETMRPLLVEAAKYLEKAYQLDENMTDALQYLKNVYYILNDGENLKRVETLLL